MMHRTVNVLSTDRMAPVSKGGSPHGSGRRHFATVAVGYVCSPPLRRSGMSRCSFLDHGRSRRRRRLVSKRRVLPVAPDYVHAVPLPLQDRCRRVDYRHASLPPRRDHPSEPWFLFHVAGAAHIAGGRRVLRSNLHVLEREGQGRYAVSVTGEDGPVTQRSGLHFRRLAASRSPQNIGAAKSRAESEGTFSTPSSTVKVMVICSFTRI